MAGNQIEMRASATVSKSAKAMYSISSATSTDLNIGGNLLLESKGSSFILKSSDKFTVDSVSSSAFSTNGNFLLSSTNEFDIVGHRKEEINAGGDLAVDVNNNFIFHSEQKIILDSKKEIDMSSKTDMRLTSSSNGLSLKAGTSLELQSGSNVELLGNTITLNAHSALSARAGTNLDVRGQSVKFSRGSDSKALYLASNGRLSLGQMHGDARLNVNGEMVTTGTTTAREFVSPSDNRLKDNVLPLKFSMERFKELRTVKYNWNDLALKTRLINNVTKNEIGLIAQNVEEIFPELIRDIKILDSAMTFKTVDYSRLNAILIEAVKDNHAYITNLQHRVFNLKKRYLQKLKRKKKLQRNIQ